MVWISSRYSVLESQPATYPKAADSFVELSDYYLGDLSDAIKTLRLPVDPPIKEDEYWYGNESAGFYGYYGVVSIHITGPGYMFYGCTLGMDRATVQKKMLSAGMLDMQYQAFDKPQTYEFSFFTDYQYSYTCDSNLSFNHPTGAVYNVDYDGVDGRVSVYFMNDIAVAISMGSYS